MSQIIKLDFVKKGNTSDTTNYANIDLNNEDNINKIKKFILPIISENEGWGTLNLNSIKFEENPEEFQDALNATLFDNVHVLLDEDKKPAALLEYLVETIISPISIERMEFLHDLVSFRDSWDELVTLNVVKKDILDQYFDELFKYFQGKRIYSEIGVVLRPDLQGKRTGYSQELYKIMEDGISFGWTSNPIVVAQWRKVYKELYFFPMLDENIANTSGLAALAILFADLKTYDQSKYAGLKFGALKSEYFVSSRSEEYLKINSELHSSSKITFQDMKRIEYLLSENSTQGTLIGIT